ncbi:hypothetical protein [Streptomyces noursei]|uniref:hypothetical protein n=1 Tax=Streptomyces noursei TaxID=1971 RepID=UPI0030079B6D
MYFTTLHRGEDGVEHRDCFVDSDGIVRLPHGLASAETVTHWPNCLCCPASRRTSHWEGTCSRPCATPGTPAPPPDRRPQTR